MIDKSSGLLIRNITEEVAGVSTSLMNFLNMILDIFVVISIFFHIFHRTWKYFYHFFNYSSWTLYFSKNNY